MQNSALKARLDSSYLSGANQSWIEQLYEDFLTDPDSVDANWRSTFQQLPVRESNRINSTLKRVNISAARRKTLHVTLQRSPTLTPM
ncbi:hypothetical protein DMI60_13890 [Escherichia coli]|nr:hypothetical protein [Escherichia coli]NYY75182.1 hypothetical protein [Escherichia coli]